MSREVFEYAALRAVPRVERGEFVNVGVIVYCRQRDYLAARTLVDEARLRALCENVDVDAVRAAVAAVERICAGGEAAGPAGAPSPGQRFRWLVAPRSTIVQAGPVHPGLTDDPAADLDRLFDCLVA